MGIATVYLAAGLKSGKIKLGSGKTFTVPGIGTLKFNQNNLAIVGNLDIFNADNIDQFSF
jgi:hypothetical protein